MQHLEHPEDGPGDGANHGPQPAIAEGVHLLKIVARRHQPVMLLRAEIHLEPEGAVGCDRECHTRFGARERDRVTLHDQRSIRQVAC